MSTPTFSVAQQVAAFTFAVDSAADLTFTNVTDMQAYVEKMSNINLADTIIQGFIGSDWTPVWGPVVWVNPAQQGPSFIVDNTMACYYSPSQKLFVIPIAGTNPGSMFDWKQEDFDITTLVSWGSISTGSGTSSGAISTGTYNGINALLQGMTSNGTSMVSALATYISTNKITGATIAIGGHSLGGALAPCMGLYLYDNLSTLGLTGQNIAVYAYAGPTPGNETFASYYNSRINAPSFTYSSLSNTIDVVPQAWVVDSLGTIPTIYGNNTTGNIIFNDSPANTFVGVLATAMQVASVKASLTFSLKHGVVNTPYTQVAGLTPFTASFNTNVDQLASLIAEVFKYGEKYGISDTYMSDLGNLVRFMYQAAAQHTPSYFGGTISLPGPTGIWTSPQVAGYLQIDNFTQECQTNRKNNPPAAATFVSRTAIVIKRLTGLDLHNMDALSSAAAQKIAEDPAAVA